VEAQLAMDTSASSTAAAARSSATCPKSRAATRS